MYLGPYENLREMLNREFDVHHYTDDNEVVDGRKDEQSTVAVLWVIADDTIRIEPTDGKPWRTVYVLGARK